MQPPGDYPGYYSVNGEIFTNKMYAVKRAVEIGGLLQWHYFDDVFSGVNTKNLGQVSLSELYRQRAQQLRDSYDYLILSYSGGSDSWNILNTFLKNNIKLDCVFVLRSTQVTDKNLYTPNMIDTTDYNHVSEWDFIIKKDLEWLVAHHPEIHIEIGDWTDILINSHKSPFERLLETTTTQNSISTLLKNVCPCQFELNKLGQGKTVGKINGADKPMIEEHLGKYYFFFVDVMTPTPTIDVNPSGLEPFYISHKFPSLNVERAYAVLSYYKSMPERLPMLKSAHTRPPGKSIDDVYQMFFLMESEERAILYPDWDMRKFQADKAKPSIYLPPGVRSGDAFLWKLPEFQEFSNKWAYHWNELYSQADQKNRQHFVVDSQFRPIYTKRHFLADA